MQKQLIEDYSKRLVAAKEFDMFVSIVWSWFMARQSD